MKWKCSDLKCVQKPTGVGLIWHTYPYSSLYSQEQSLKCIVNFVSLTKSKKSATMTMTLTMKLELRELSKENFKPNHLNVPTICIFMCCRLRRVRVFGRADTSPSNVDQLVLRGAPSSSVSSISPPATAESGVVVTEANHHGHPNTRQVSRWFGVKQRYKQTW